MIQRAVLMPVKGASMTMKKLSEYAADIEREQEKHRHDGVIAIDDANASVLAVLAQALADLQELCAQTAERYHYSKSADLIARDIRAIKVE